MKLLGDRFTVLVRVEDEKDPRSYTIRARTREAAEKIALQQAARDAFVSLNYVRVVKSSDPD